MIRIKESVGLDENLKYVVNTETTYINNATSFAEADNLLDAAISNIINEANIDLKSIDFNDEKTLEIMQTRPDISKEEFLRGWNRKNTQQQPHISKPML